jgi:hypothetical protein
VSRPLRLGGTRLTRLQSKSKETEAFLEPGLESPRRGAECEWQTRSLCTFSAPVCDSLLVLYDKPPAAEHIVLSISDKVR